jgi:hypothetical protein
MTQQLSELLSSMTAILNGLVPMKDAKVEYQGVCDGLIWSDETPRMFMNEEQEQVFRYLVQHRTSIIMGEPISHLQSLWNDSRKAFPMWAGFQKERCEPSATLVEHVTQARGELESFFEEDANM